MGNYSHKDCLDAFCARMSQKANELGMCSVADGKVLVSKNADECIMPASTTKLLTALTVLEYVDDLNTRLPVTQDMIDLFPSGFYTGDFLPGDSVSLIDLLHAMMLPSSNTACFIMGCYVGGILLSSQAK